MMLPVQQTREMGELSDGGVPHLRPKTGPAVDAPTMLGHNENSPLLGNIRNSYLYIHPIKNAPMHIRWGRLPQLPHLSLQTAKPGKPTGAPTGQNARGSGQLAGDRFKEEEGWKWHCSGKVEPDRYSPTHPAG